MAETEKKIPRQGHDCCILGTSGSFYAGQQPVCIKEDPTVCAETESEFHQFRPREKTGTSLLQQAGLHLGYSRHHCQEALSSKLGTQPLTSEKERKIYACRSAACIKERASHWLPPIEGIFISTPEPQRKQFNISAWAPLLHRG
eukprot:1139871-Pelagomonas_calceolata.AAC.3